MKAINDLYRHNAPIASLLSEAMNRVVASGWFVLGSEVKSFEEEFSSYCGVTGCVTVGNGTDALELGLRALGVGAGDEVVTVANAGGYSSTAILAAGARPVYADIISETMNMDPVSLHAALSPRTKAVIVTHLYGRMADMPPLMRIAEAAGIPVMEDCAQAHGAASNGKRAGAWGTLAAFSFYPTKNLGALGDGGAVVSKDALLTGRLRQLRQYGWSGKYRYDLPGGRNSRLDELQAAVLRCKLPLLDGWNARRREVAARYSKHMRHPMVNCPRIGGEDFVAHLYVIRTERREKLRQHLAANKVPVDVHYPIPDHRQAVWTALARPTALPETERAAEQVLTLPCFPEMTDDEVDIVCSAINSWNA